MPWVLHILKYRRQFQLDVQPATLLQHNPVDFILPAMAANSLVSSDTFFFISRSKDPGKQREEPRTVLNDYETILQNAKLDILEKDEMLNALRMKVACLQERHESCMLARTARNAEGQK